MMHFWSKKCIFNDIVISARLVMISDMLQRRKMISVKISTRKKCRETDLKTFCKSSEEAGGHTLGFFAVYRKQLGLSSVQSSQLSDVEWRRNEAKSTIFFPADPNYTRRLCFSFKWSGRVNTNIDKTSREWRPSGTPTNG